MLLHAQKHANQRQKEGDSFPRERGKTKNSIGNVAAVNQSGGDVGAVIQTRLGAVPSAH
jgi:hypothetical protein